VWSCHYHINFNTLGISEFPDLNPHSGWAHSKVADRKCPLDWGCQETKQKARTWTIVGAVHGECHTLLTLKTMICISKEMRIGLVDKVFNTTFNDSSVISDVVVSFIGGGNRSTQRNQRHAIIHSKRVESLLPIQIV
jgi:CxxC motif-containing protein